MLDPRIGRWLKPDALERKFPSNSTYSFSINSPISVIDPDGNDIIIIGNKEYRRQIQQTIRDLYNSGPSGRKVVVDLMSSKEVFVIVENQKQENRYLGFGSSKAEGYIIFNYNENEVYDPANGLGDLALPAPPITTLAHELKHAHDDLTGATKSIKNLDVVNQENPLVENPKFGEPHQPKYFLNAIKATEVGAVEYENQVRGELGLTLRTHYGGQDIFNKEVSEKVYDFGTNYFNSYSSPLLLNKTETFDYSKYNVDSAVKSTLNEVYKANKWWDLIIESKVESFLDYGFGNDTRYPRAELTGDDPDKAVRLTIEEQ